MTLYWDTEMLLGWTLSLTHCFISEAKRRGSDDRSHFSFLVHLENKDEKKYVSTWGEEKDSMWKEDKAFDRMGGNKNSCTNASNHLPSVTSTAWKK